MDLLPSDWSDAFALETPLAELVARGAVLYVGILVFMRVMPRRTGGELATMDLVLVLLVTEAASHALGDYTSLGDGMLLIAAIMGFSYAVNYLSYRFRFVERLTSHPPVQVVCDGRMLRRNMRREYLTEEELMSHLRKEGIDAVEAVTAAYVEGEGQITVVSAE